MKPSFTHRAPLQLRFGGFHHTDRISAGMAVNTFEYCPHLVVNVSKPGVFLKEKTM